MGIKIMQCGASAIGTHRTASCIAEMDKDRKLEYKMTDYTCTYKVNKQ